MTSAEHDFRRIRFRSPETVDRRWLEWFRDEFSRRMFQSDVETDPDAPFWLDATTRHLPDPADPRLGTQPIGAIALDVGFGDLSYFNRTFRRRFGQTPSDVRAAASHGMTSGQ